MTPELVMINERWPIWLPPHRAARPEWPWWEKERLAAMHDTIEDGMVVWDIGAEEGDLPALYATWGADLCLVEPNPLVWPNIRYIFNQNHLDLPRWFVGLCSDKVDLDPAELDFDPGSARDGWPLVAHGPIIGDHGFRHIFDGQPTTPTTTIDRLREGWPAPDVVTMDVEGGEFHVLRGASKVLAEDRPVVFVSIHPQFMKQMYGESDLALHAWMTGYDYTAAFLGADHEQHWRYDPH